MSPLHERGTGAGQGWAFVGSLCVLYVILIQVFGVGAGQELAALSHIRCPGTVSHLQLVLVASTSLLPSKPSSPPCQGEELPGKCSARHVSLG